MNRGERIEYYTPVAPSPRERDAFRDAVRIARELGVRFKAGEAEARWWRRESHEPFGFIDRSDTRPLPVWLGAGGNTEQIISTSAHELKHARDYLDGRDRFDTRVGLDGYVDGYNESEARARAFAEKVLAYWRAERRPRPTIPQPGVSTPAIERSPRMRIANGPALDVATLLQSAAQALRNVDQAKLHRRRNIATSRRSSWRSSQVMSDAALVRFTAIEALLSEQLAADDMEDAERQLLLGFKNQLAAHLEAGDREAVAT